MNCSWFGLSYKASFHVLRAGEQISTQAFSPLEMSWSTVVDIWPLPRRMNYVVQVMKDDRLYSIVTQVLGGSLIQTRGKGIQMKENGILLAQFLVVFFRMIRESHRCSDTGLQL